jgi:hypothetical protein
VEGEAADQRQATRGLAGEGPPDRHPRRRGICHSRKDRCGARRGEGPSDGNGPCPHGGLSTAAAAGGTAAGRPGDAARTQEERGGNSASMGGGKTRARWRCSGASGREGPRTWALLAALAWDRGRKGGAGRAERRSPGRGEAEVGRGGQSGAPGRSGRARPMAGAAPGAGGAPGRDGGSREGRWWLHREGRWKP